MFYRVGSAEVAQLAEHSPEKAGVRSSILRLGTTIFPHGTSSFVLVHLPRTLFE